MTSLRIVLFFFLRLVQENIPLISVVGKWKAKFLIKIRFLMKNIMEIILCGFFIVPLCFHSRFQLCKLY